MTAAGPPWEKPPTGEPTKGTRCDMLCVWWAPLGGWKQACRAIIMYGCNSQCNAVQCKVIDARAPRASACTRDQHVCVQHVHRKLNLHLRACAACMQHPQSTQLCINTALLKALPTVLTQSCWGLLSCLLHCRCHRHLSAACRAPCCCRPHRCRVRRCLRLPMMRSPQARRLAAARAPCPRSRPRRS